MARSGRVAAAPSFSCDPDPTTDKRKDLSDAIEDPANDSRRGRPDGSRRPDPLGRARRRGRNDELSDTAESAGAEAPPFRGHLTRDGVEVSISIDPLDDADSLMEDGYARVRVEMRDGHTGKPLSAVYPAAWLDLLPPGEGEEADSCKTKVETFLGGSLLSQAEVDLNVFYVLALNDDASISVVDPLFGFGGSKLLAMPRLEKPGEDWALTEDQQRLFVAMPEADKVAVIETLGWKVVTNAEVGPGPRRVALQPDGAFLWVVFDGTDEDGTHRSGVSIVGTTALKELERIPTAAGATDLVFSGDNRLAFVANAGAGTVTVIDVARRETLAEVATGSRPSHLAWSGTADALYVGDPVDGTVAVIDGASYELLTTIPLEPGIGKVAFAPDGRFAFVPNPAGNSLFILDAAKNRMVQHGEVENGPDQVAFSDELAYVRHRDSEIILTIPLAAIGDEGRPIQVIDFPGGTHPPGEDNPSPAAGMVQAPGAPAMLIANAEDGSIYYYKEGMAAPMGQFKAYDRRPRAVMVVDRSLTEAAPGVYQTGIRLRRPGSYELAFFVDTPRIVHCFPLTVAVNPAKEAARRPEILVQPLGQPQGATVGDEVAVSFRVLDTATGQGVEGLKDFEVLTVLAPGRWHHREVAEEVGGGVYRLTFTPPLPGIYYAYAGTRSRGATFNRNPYRTFRVEAAAGRRRERHLPGGVPMSRTPETAQTAPPVRIRRVLTLTGALLALTTLWALAATPARAQHDHAGHAGHDPHAAHKAMMHGAAPADDREIATEVEGGFDIPDVPVLTQDGEAVHFYSDLVAGRTVVMNFVFTTCTTICPPMGANFGRLQKELGDRLGRDVHLISVSVDPTTDTPERLKAWATKFGAQEGWTLVTGDQQEMERLLKALEVFTADIADHAPIVLIGNDPAGEWTRAYGLAGPKTLAEIVDRVGSTDSTDATGAAGGAR